MTTLLASPPPQPTIGVGTWAWGNTVVWGYDPSQDAELEATFQRCLARGLCFFDTADSYGTGRLNGRSESLLGRFAAAAQPQSPFTIATKLAPFPWRVGRGGFRGAFAASRRRLGGHLDRVQLHWSTARYAPWQEAALLDGLADLVLAGEVAEVGLSNMGPRRLRWAHDRLAARGVVLRSLQVQCSLLAPQPLEPGGVAEVCRDLGIELIAYSPLALGLLSRPPGALVAPPKGLRGVLFRRLWPAAQPLLTHMAELGRERPGGLAAVALNWCRAHGAMPIPGLRSLDQVEAAAASCSWELDINERQRLDRLSQSCQARMPANPFQSA